MLCKLHTFAQRKNNGDMATIKAILRTRKDAGKLRFRVSDGRGVQLWYASDIEVKVSLWDEKAEQIKNRVICPKEVRTSVNAAVKSTRELLEKVYDEHKAEIKTSEDLARFLDEELHPEKKEPTEAKKKTFFEAYNEFMAKHEISEREKKNYRTLERTLHRYQGYMNATKKGGYTLDYDTMTTDELNNFFCFCKDEFTLMHEKKNAKLFGTLLREYPLLDNIKRETTQVEQRGANTIIKMKQRYKCFWSWLLKGKYTLNNPFADLVIGTAKYGTPYYITPAERDFIAEFDLSASPKLERQRDIFIFQCLIGCRVGDLLEMTGKNMVGDEVHYIPHKTCKNKPERIEVPLNPKAMEIVQKYGRIGKDEPLLPFISAQKYNDAIKEIFTVCGITRCVPVIDPKTGESVLMPINEIASSHMARRTFVGTLYKKVKDPNLIGKLSGHSENSRAFARYRKIDKDTERELIALL